MSLAGIACRSGQVFYQRSMFPARPLEADEIRTIRSLYRTGVGMYHIAANLRLSYRQVRAVLMRRA